MAVTSSSLRARCRAPVCRAKDLSYKRSIGCYGKSRSHFHGMNDAGLVVRKAITECQDTLAGILPYEQLEQMVV